MSKITQVEPQKKSASRRTQRFNIFLDGVFAFGADQDLVVDRRLIVGKEITPEDLTILTYEAEVGKLMERMYDLFSRRQRTEKEVRNYFQILNFKRKTKDEQSIGDLAIELVIEKLKQKRMIDDRVFAMSWIEARQKSKKKGKNAIKAELIQKGIDREIIEEVMSDELGMMGQEEVLAKQALEKKLRLWQNLPEVEFRKKATEFLVRRGFDYSIAKDVITKTLEGDD